MNFQNHYNREEFPTDHEVNEKPSLTVPDQSLSVKELLTRYARGLPLEGERVPLYEGDTGDGRDPATMDLSEIHDELRDISSRVVDQPVIAPAPSAGEDVINQDPEGEIS